MNEFTGERVIPGQVNDDLWAEHVARYAFAERFAAGKRVLDIGCGTGYGTAGLAKRATLAVGIDVAAEAVGYATHFSNARFVQASAVALPFTAASFDVVTAFEVIEHLQDWKTLLAEARRVLDPVGVFVVSTPNKLYYAESREKSGPNPFHEHEFTYAEFGAALAESFPHVAVMLQDNLSSQAFRIDQQIGDSQIDSKEKAPDLANFFIGLCSARPIADVRPFLFASRSANMLREREQHIRLLEGELIQVREWLEETRAERDRAAGIIAELNQENIRKTEWAVETERRLTADLAARAAQLAETVKLLDRAEATVVERTEWAQRLDRQVEELSALVAAVRESRWVRMGRKVGLGPRLAPKLGDR